MSTRDAEFFRQTFADKAASLARHRFEKIFDLFQQKCESPIELAMLAGIIYAFRHDHFALKDEDLVWFSFRECEWPKVSDGLNGSIGLWLQASVGEYRADFLMAVAKNNGEYGWLAIECDGHDFHERTKEQAERDRSRDRWMIENGIQVIRFTGREIWRDPEQCARQVGSILSQVAGREVGAWRASGL